jgi:hypothetical protein
MRRLMMVCSAFVMVAGAATAGELPKEGKVNGATYYAAGTWKGIAMGKDAWISTFDDSGGTVGGGLLDHVAWHCIGVQDGLNGKANSSGRCVGTDQSSDQLMLRFNSADEQMPDKNRLVNVVLLGGTGKYLGITGGWTLIVHGGDFKAATGDNVYMITGTDFTGDWKLP